MASLAVRNSLLVVVAVFVVYLSILDFNSVSDGGNILSLLSVKTSEGCPKQSDVDLYYNGSYCPSMKYAKVTCPRWDNTKPDGGDDVDYRVRWIYENQHPKNCSSANYILRGFQERSFGCNFDWVIVSSLVLTLRSNRVFVIDTQEPFWQAGCPTKDWDCYYEPISNCTVKDVEGVVQAEGGKYGSEWVDPSHRVVWPNRVRAVAFLYWCMLAQALIVFGGGYFFFHTIMAVTSGNH